MSTTRRFKKRYLLLLPVLIFPFFSDSCMRMRMAPEETAVYFESNGISFQDKTAVLGDYELHYIETGDPTAHTLLMLHGSPGAWDAYKTYLSDPVLAEQFRLVAVDRPGFGFTSFGSSMNLNQQAELLTQFARSIDNQKGFTLMGHSYGGPLTVAMGIKGQDVFERLVVVAGSLDPAAEKPEKWRIPIKAFPLKYYVPGSLRTSNEELWMLKEDLYDLAPKLKEVTQEVYLIHGTEDMLVPYSNVPFMEKEMSSARSIRTWTMPDKNHFILWEEESAIKDSLLVWMKPAKPVQPIDSILQ
ncbi:alpha/beta fold hydrolase [Aureicoccus marinus]|nr:alpha/beta hydrolase [Aureicoccus marinus]